MLGSDAKRQARDGRIDRVFDFIESQLHTDMSLDEQARIACLSPFHFLRTFKSVTGMTPRCHVSERRILRARTLLRGTRSTMSEIAHLCGFSDQAHFATTFRRLAIHRGRDSFDVNQPFRARCYTIARHKLIDHLRCPSRERTRSLSDATLVDEDSAVNSGRSKPTWSAFWLC